MKLGSRSVDTFLDDMCTPLSMCGPRMVRLCCMVLYKYINPWWYKRCLKRSESTFLSIGALSSVELKPVLVSSTYSYRYRYYVVHISCFEDYDHWLLGWQLHEYWGHNSFFIHYENQDYSLYK